MYLNCDVKFVFYCVSWSKKFESQWSKQWLQGVMSLCYNCDFCLHIHKCPICGSFGSSNSLLQQVLKCIKNPHMISLCMVNLHLQLPCWRKSTLKYYFFPWKLDGMPYLEK